MRFLSLFSGMECASLAWEPLGWECVAVAEIEPNACRLLAHRFPQIPNLGDVTKLTEENIRSLGHIDIVVMGAPCTDVSMAGTRKGFFDEDMEHTRSGLFHYGLRIARWTNARFILYENVKGLFSSSSGRDFASVVADMAGLRNVGTPANGWGTEGAAVGDNGLLEWAVLDSQWFGVAQRRERVFALLDTGNWANRPPILLEPKSRRGLAPPRGKPREAVAGSTKRGPGEDSGGGFVKAVGFSAGNSATSYGIAYTEEATPPLRSAGSGTNQVPTVCYSTDFCAVHPYTFEESTGPLISNRQWSVCYGGGNIGEPIDVAMTIKAGRRINFDSETTVIDGYSCRRFLPVECERLMGAPDGWTDIPGVSEMARYKMLGNGFVVQVVRWIGEQIIKALEYEEL